MTDRTMPDALPLRPGDPDGLGGYELLGRLGEGGQGSVFLGRPTGTGEALPAADHVAIKLLHGGLTGDASARARFVRELEVAKRVARFCTAQVLDADVAGDRPYIVSEYVPGVSLHSVVHEEGPRTDGALERLAISTLTALTAIHQAGIVHRDFKPHNVMMGPDGPRVIDFGVARALGAAGETQNVGTPAYMAPEHFTGGEVGTSSDMFAWGTTMVFAATGRPAFGNDEMGLIMHRILTGEPDLGDLSGPMRELVLACLDKEPARRPTARQAQERLVGAASGAPSAMPSRPAAPPPAAPPAAATAAAAASPAPAPTAPGPRSGATPQKPPRPPRDRRAAGRKGGRLVPIVAAAAVAAVLTGGAVWAVTRPGDDLGGDRQVSAADPGQGGQEAPDRTATEGTDGPSRPPAQQQPGGERTPEPAQTPPSPRPSTPPSSSAPPDRSGGHTGATGRPDPEPPNRYSPQAVCTSGGSGGYYVQRSMSVPGGVAYLLYNGSGSNCAVMIKNTDVGTESPASVWIQMQGGSTVADSGRFAWYAGPVYVDAPGTCVRFGGNGRSAPYGNCG